MNRTHAAGLAGVGMCVFVFLIIVAPPVLAFAAGFLIGAVFLYAILQVSPASYDEEEQEMTEDEILFVYDT